jgi:hypothetical protein
MDGVLNHKKKDLKLNKIGEYHWGLFFNFNNIGIRNLNRNTNAFRLGCSFVCSYLVNVPAGNEG